MLKQHNNSPFYDPAEGMSPSERSHYYYGRLRRIIEHAYRYAPAVKARMDSVGVVPSQIQGVEDIIRIPIIRKDELLNLQKADPPFGGCLAAPMDQIQRIFVSPGPLYEVQGSGAEYETVARGLYAAGMRKGDIMMNSFSYHLVPAGTIMDEAARSLGLVVIPAGIGNTEVQAQIMRDAKVTCFAGTPSFLLTLLKKTEELGFLQDVVLRRALVGGEMLPDSLRRELEEIYRVHVSQSYGTAELTLVAYECVQRSGMHVSEEVFVEIVDPVTGVQVGPSELGEVVVTSFHEAYCLIRLGTGDLATYTDEPCVCGRTSQRLLAIKGRVGDAVKARGMFIHPRQIDQCLAAEDDVARYQVVVGRRNHRDTLTLRIELRNENIDRGSLSKRLAQRFEEVSRLRVDVIEYTDRDSIPKGAKPIIDERRWE